MKRNLLILVWVVFGTLFFSTQGLAECPEEPNDPGECDTVYVELYPPDQEVLWLPFFARFPIYVTHDIVNVAEDSLAGFVIPLCYSHSNESKYCSVSAYWNNIMLYPHSDLEGSIFRHFIEGQDTVIHNWMMDLSQKPYPHGPAIEDWDTKILELASDSSWVYWNEGADSAFVPPHWWMALAASAKPDRRMEDGSRILLATMTLKLQDTMRICIDTCWWPPSSRLQFGSGVRPAYTYIPRHNLPICERIRFPGGLPHFTQCPWNEWHHCNGIGFQSGPFAASTFWRGGLIADVSASFEGSGLENVSVAFTVPPPAEQAEGYVTYDVVDHCQPGGVITLTARDEYAGVGTCNFDVVFANDSPHLNVLDTCGALAGYTVVLQVSANDPNDDSVAILLDAFWHEPDSLQPPTNPPFYDGGNPGLLTWLPAQADSGFWICSFSATDVCGAVDTHRVTIFVGTLVCGDCIEDTLIDLGDLLYLLSYLYKGGPSPVPPCRGDVNCDAVVDLGDMLHLISYLYKSGPAPCFLCCAGVPARTYSRPDLTH